MLRVRTKARHLVLLFAFIFFALINASPDSPFVRATNSIDRFMEKYPAAQHLILIIPTALLASLVFVAFREEQRRLKQHASDRELYLLANAWDESKPVILTREEKADLEAYAKRFKTSLNETESLQFNQLVECCRGYYLGNPNSGFGKFHHRLYCYLTNCKQKLHSSED